MSEITNTNKPWLVAAWPGMGNVAVIAAGYLIQKLGMIPLAELPSRGYFDIQQVVVHKGVVARPHMPRSAMYAWKNPTGGRDLVVSLSEAQPATGTYAFAHEIMDRAAKLGVERVFTFASLASQLHPTQEPRVFGAGTNEAILNELMKQKAERLEDGQIGGLNGVMLGAAMDRNVQGACLLGEIPFFAAGVPNPKAARAVLEILCSLAGIKLDFSELKQHSETVESALLELMERMQSGNHGPEEHMGELPEAPDLGEPIGADEPDAPKPEPKEKQLDFDTRSRIEQLFEEARKDRAKAVALKRELDRHGVFGQYEDRFLDLFRRAD